MPVAVPSSSSVRPLEAVNDRNLNDEELPLLDALIIGAGPSGLISLRNLLVDRRLKRILCVDRNPDVGGIWLNHVPDYATMQTLKQEWAVHGVEMDAKEPERRASAQSVLQWVHDYAERWNLHEYLQLNTEVVACERVPAASGKMPEFLPPWLVPKMVLLPGQESCTVPIVHNHAIRSAQQLPVKELLVIGTGASSMDVLLQACRRGTQRVLHIHRRANLGIPDNFGIPEMTLLRFLFYSLRLPTWLVAWMVVGLSRLWVWWHGGGVQSWMPAWTLDLNSCGCTFIYKSELIPYARPGQLRTRKTTIQKLDGDAVYLNDGTVCYPELIVCATGWSQEYRFLPWHEAAQRGQVEQRLYCRFLDLDYPGLYFISNAIGFQCATQNADIISKAALQVMTGSWEKPTKAHMECHLKQWLATRQVALPGRVRLELEKEGFRFDTEDRTFG